MSNNHARDTAKGVFGGLFGFFIVLPLGILALLFCFSVAGNIADRIKSPRSKGMSEKEVEAYRRNAWLALSNQWATNAPQ